MHWLAYSAAAVGFLIVLFATLAWGGGEIGKILEFVVWMIGIAAVGRSLRYVLANE